MPQLTRRRTRWIGTAMALLLSAVGLSERAFAHPMGNFSVNHYAKIKIEPDIGRDPLSGGSGRKFLPIRRCGNSASRLHPRTRPTRTTSMGNRRD